MKWTFNGGEQVNDIETVKEHVSGGRGVGFEAGEEAEASSWKAPWVICGDFALGQWESK